MILKPEELGFKKHPDRLAYVLYCNPYTFCLQYNEVLKEWVLSNGYNSSHSEENLEITDETLQCLFRQNLIDKNIIVPKNLQMYGSLIGGFRDCSNEDFFQLMKQSEYKEPLCLIIGRINNVLRIKFLDLYLTEKDSC